MEVKWRLLDARRVKVRINQETLSTDEMDALIRALGRVRAKMHPRVDLRSDGEAPSSREAGVPMLPLRGAEPPPAAVTDALDTIAELLAKTPENDRDGVAGLLHTFATIGHIARDSLALLVSAPAVARSGSDT